VLSHLSVQGASGNAQCLCSLVFVALGLLEHLEDKVSLGVLKGGGICLGPGKGVFDVLGEITCFDHLPFGQDHRMLYDILELPKGGSSRAQARLTLGEGLAVSAFPLSVPV